MYDIIIDRQKVSFIGSVDYEYSVASDILVCLAMVQNCIFSFVSYDVFCFTVHGNDCTHLMKLTVIDLTPSVVAH